jgi:ribonuclease HI
MTNNSIRPDEGENDSEAPVTIHTDGACSGNPGPGGWAAVLEKPGRVKEISGGDPDTTNNRMELTAVIRALEYLRGTDRKVRLVTDSEYVMKGLTEWLPGWKARGWKTSDRKPVKNADLWQRLEVVAGKHRVSWEWTRDTMGPANERADEWARREVERLKARGRQA